MTREERLLEKLKTAHLVYGKIVIGVDFDDTIFPFTSDSVEAHAEAREVRALLDRVRPYTVQCLWTVANDWSLRYKKFICEHHYAYEFDFYNESPITADEDVRKPHFNLLLDDCAGLGQGMKILAQFADWVESAKDNKDETHKLT